MKLMNWFKGAKAKAFVFLGSFAMLLGVGASIYTVKAAVENEVVETKADSTTKTMNQILIQIVDKNNATSEVDNFWIYCWNITVDTSSSVFDTIADANTAGALWSKLGYNTHDQNGTFHFVGSFEWYYGERSYKWDFPWFVTGFQYKIEYKGTMVGFNGGGNPSISTRQYEKREFWTAGGWHIDGYSTGSQSFGATAYTMTFDSNGGTPASSTSTFAEWEKTSAPSAPTKDMCKFSKWTETNSPSASAYSFGSNMTEDMTLYAQWDRHLLMWLPSGDKTNAYCWYNDGSDHYDVAWPGKAGSTLVIDGVTYYYVTVGIDATYCIFNNGKGSQTSDLTIASGALDGHLFYDESGGGWEEPQMDITYKDQGNKTYSGTTGSSRPSKHNWALSTTIPTDMGKPGYTFGGWYDNSSCTGSAITSISAYSSTTDITLYAKWTANGFTISYNANTGSGTTDSTSLTYDAAGSLRTNSFTAPNAGHIFKEWNTQSNGKGTSYSSGASLTIELVNALYSLSPTGNKTLYAIWESGEGAAKTYATSFNTSIGGVCKNDNTTDTATLATRWGTQKTTYTGLASHVKYWLAKTTHSTDTSVTNMLDKYDYVCGKYGANGRNLLGDSPDFLNRNPSVPVSPAWAISGSNGNESPLTLTLWIVLGAGILGMGAIGTAYFVSKKKKRHQA